MLVDMFKSNSAYLSDLLVTITTMSQIEMVLDVSLLTVYYETDLLISGATNLFTGTSQCGRFV